MENSRLPLFDVIIAGGGPAGLSAALVLARACRRVVVVDSGMPRNRRARVIHGFLGRDGSSPRQLTSDARAELRKYDVALFDDEAVDVVPMEDLDKYGIATGFMARTKSGLTLLGRKLLFATGMCDDLPELEGFDACYGLSVHHCPYCDGWEHRGQHLLAYGTDVKAAVGLGIMLRGWSSRVTVVTDGKPIDPHEEKRLRANEIGWREAKIVALLHDDGKLTGAELEKGEGLQADALFFNTSQRSQCELPRKFGCEFDAQGTVLTGDKQHTKCHGVFVAGDADGDVQFAIVAAAEGATAAVAINRELQDEDRCEDNPAP